MEILKVENSSAISQISFHDEENLVGVSFTYNPKKEYLFFCDEFEDVKDQIKSTQITKVSLGKLINSFRKSGTLSIIDI